MKVCPNCRSKTGLRKVLYGMPMPSEDPTQPLVDESKYVLGGCCISANDPTTRCIECGWQGKFANNIPYSIGNLKA
jgi:hypothetical protein